MLFLATDVRQARGHLRQQAAAAAAASVGAKQPVALNHLRNRR